MANTQRMTRKSLGEILIQAGVIDDPELQAARAEQAQTNEPLAEVLVRREFATEAQIAQTLASRLSLPYLSAAQVDVSPSAAALVPPALMRAHGLVPLDRFGTCVTLLVSGLLSTEVLEQIEQHTGCEVHLYVGTASDVRELIDRLDGQAEAEADPSAEAARPADHGPSTPQVATG